VESQPIIGAEKVPLRKIVVDNFVFIQKPSSEYTLAETDPLFEVINRLGLNDAQNFSEHSIVSYFDMLEERDVVLDVMELLLEFDDRTVLHKLARKIRMALRREKKRDILKRMTRGQAAGVLQNFFLMNFSLTQESNDTYSKMG
jgi:hypothetical protein